MITLKELLHESLRNEQDKSPINESIKIGDLQKWEKFSKENCPGEVMDKFNAHLFDLFNNGQKEWKMLSKEGQLEDFLCQDAWDNWCYDDDDLDYDDIDTAKEFWDANYEKFFKF